MTEFKVGDTVNIRMYFSGKLEKGEVTEYPLQDTDDDVEYFNNYNEALVTIIDPEDGYGILLIVNVEDIYPYTPPGPD